jgi:hypothetical protein
LENSNNDIKVYSAEDIARYWEGKMSPLEMHALEAAAMDDPFLADALEGYSGMQPATVSADVQELHERLARRAQDDKKVVPFKWWRAAAILIFLGGASVLTYVLMQQNASSRIAKNESATQETKADTAPALPADTLTASSFALVDSTTQTITAASKEAEKQAHHYSTNSVGVNQQGNASAPVTSTEKVAVPDLSAYKAKDTFTRDVAKAEIESKRDSVMLAANEAEANDRAKRAAARLQNPPVANNQQPNANYRTGSEPAMYNYFSGRVVDQRNNAIPFASVRVNNNNQVASTNAEGYFNIKSPDTVLSLSFNSVGFESRQLTMRGNEPQSITLDEAQGKLKEVVVTGASSPKKKSKSSTLNVYTMDAQPVIGWDEYNKYLETSKRLSNDKSITGEVIVSFWVNKRGKLSDLTIEKSLGKIQDAEALRLVKEGPEWKLTKGRKTRARVIVTF